MFALVGSAKQFNKAIVYFHTPPAVNEAQLFHILTLSVFIFSHLYGLETVSYCDFNMATG